MNRLTLNIGLHTTMGKVLTQGEVMDAVLAHVGNGVAARLTHSATEPTIVVDITTPHRQGFMHQQHAVARLSDFLKQDCIAAWFHGYRQGVLCGSNAAARGVFNEAHFTHWRTGL